MTSAAERDDAAVWERCEIQNAESWAADMSAGDLKAWHDQLVRDAVRIARLVDEAEAEFDEHVNLAKNGNPGLAFAGDAGLAFAGDEPDYEEFAYPEDLETTRQLLKGAQLAMRIQERSDDPPRAPKRGRNEFEEEEEGKEI